VVSSRIGIPDFLLPLGRADWVGAVRKLVFTLLLIVLSIFVGYGLVVGDFLETLSNGAMICLTCIGVA
jgi:hypothetical protein